ncbi:importin-beta amine-terminal domain protein (macronuclear) [Tetrahymena thermophila SB210]|uniref:Importin-beta amine-terminal domain protein n=1 Tax=Tetrahymena thermophila (strain SB210) TaxID=312017 RepID=I7M4Q8_TETTS|nr:importin-beta amine-terminal domain protein [Tetrahymena thermophila SB210]EAS07874.2 importin-beta amine-terminal domain protein [Tetrahymena thermophila SB210]|eukprot:XP_001028116.2 importin-beta amine-terminal domain protein [Tetrahymena thermophila SB210]
MFQPDIATLQQVAQLLQQGKLADNQQQKEVYQKIEEYSKSPEFYNYLSYILAAQNNQIQLEIRHMAGVTLKSLVERNFEHIPEQNIQFIKQNLFQSFNDQQKAIRSAIGTLMTTIIYKGGFQKWPELIEFMIQNLESTDQGAIINSIDCISKIVEDLRVNSENYAFLDSSKGGSQLNVLIPKLFSFCDPKYGTEIQSNAIHTLNLCVQPMPAALAENLDQYLQILLSNVQNSEKSIRQRAFQGITALTEIRRDAIMKRINQVIQSIIIGSQDAEYDVAKSACNFWFEYLGMEQSPEDIQQSMKCVQPYLKDLLPALLKGLQYTDDDLMNILPSTQNINNRPEISEVGDIDDCDFDENENQYDFEGNDNERETNDYGEYTLRKVCGRIIQKFSQQFRDDVFQILQPLIEQCFQSNDWKIKEVGIICLGDISEGSINSVQVHLGNIIPSLIQLFNVPGQNYLLQTSIMWTICQYRSWLIDNYNQYFDVIKSYLQCMAFGITHQMQHLQECSCQCLKDFVDNGSMILRPYLHDFIKVVTEAIKVYQNSNLNMLLDAVCTIVSTMQEEVNTPEVLQTLLPPILEKWGQLKSTDIAIKGFAECFSLLAQELESNFLIYTEYIYPKCFEMLQNYVIALNTESKDRKHINQKKQIFLMGTDLMSSIVYCTKQNFALLAQHTDLNSIIINTIDSQDSEVRSFIFTLISEISIHCPNYIAQKVEIYTQMISQHVILFPHSLDPGNYYLNTCNNAVLCLNQLCISYPEIMKPYAYQIALKIIKILEETKKMVIDVARNVCCSLCSIALLDYQNVSQHLSSFVQKFCLSVRQYNGQQKRRAFEGLFKMAFHNPNGIINYMSYIVDSFIRYQNPPQELKLQFKTLLIEYKKTLNDEQWQNFLLNSNFDQIVIKNLIQQYLS